MNTLLENPLVVRLGWTLLHFVWQGAALAAAFAVVNSLAKNATPQRRYVVAYGFLCLMAICPVITFATIKPPIPAVRVASKPASSNGSQATLVATPGISGAPAATPSMHFPDGPVVAEPEPSINAAEQHERWQSMLVAGWLLGVLLFSIRHTGGWLKLRRYRHEARRIEDPGLLQTFAELRERLGLSRVVELLESARLQVPATIGFLKPVILIPAGALTGLERWQLEAIIAHELAHVRRCDFAANFVQCVIETVLFYHPAVWWISAIVRQEREFCADDVALALCGDRTGYAVALTRLVEISMPADFAVAATGGNLLTRIRRIVAKPEPQRSGTASAMAVLLVAGILATVLMGARVFAEDSKPIEVKPGESIQAAVDKAPEGATIRVAAGEFRDRIRITKPLTLEGAGWDKTRVFLPADNEARRKEYDDKIQAAKNADEREHLIAASRAELDGPVLLVADARGVNVRGLRVEAGVKDNKKQLPPLAEFRNAQLRVTNCAFTGPAQDGIYIGDNTDVEMAECLVAGLWSEGIVIRGARGADPRVVIRDSEVRNVYHYGIQIGSGCDRVTIQRCRISGTAWHGIRYDNASPLIEGNTIYDHARCGIYASGRTRATVRGNLFLQNEMNGMSCWFDNQDLVEGNTFTANKREGLSVLGASKVKVRGNVFWANPSAIEEGKIGNDATNAKGTALLENNVFWKNNKNLPRDGKDELPADSKSLVTDPGFVDADKLDFRLTTDSAARKQSAGVAQPLTLKSPWPLLNEEKQLIPDGPSRDSNAWKKADGSVQAPVNQFQRRQELYRSVESTIKDALQIDDAEKRAAAVESVRTKILSKSSEEVAAGLVAYQSIGQVKFDKKSFREALLAQLGNRDAFVRAQAVTALSGAAGGREDLEQITKLSTDSDSSVRTAVGWALVSLTKKDLTGPEGAKWVEMLEAGNAAFRKELIHGLWGVKTTTASQERLVALSREQGELGYDTLYYALSTSPNKGEACVVRLIEYLADPDVTNVAGRAEWGLSYGVVPEQTGKVADAMIKLYEARESDRGERYALSCLEQYATEKHVPALEAMMAKPGIADDEKKKIEGIITGARQRK